MRLGGKGGGLLPGAGVAHVDTGGSCSWLTLHLCCSRHSWPLGQPEEGLTVKASCGSLRADLLGSGEKSVSLPLGPSKVSADGCWDSGFLRRPGLQLHPPRSPSPLEGVGDPSRGEKVCPIWREALSTQDLAPVWSPTIKTEQKWGASPPAGAPDGYYPHSGLPSCPGVEHQRVFLEGLPNLSLYKITCKWISTERHIGWRQESDLQTPGFES